MAYIVQIDKCMIKPSVQLCAIDIIDRQMEERLPQLARDCYSFEVDVKQNRQGWYLGWLKYVSHVPSMHEDKILARNKDKEEEMEWFLSSLS